MEHRINKLTPEIVIADDFFRLIFFVIFFLGKEKKFFITK